MQISWKVLLAPIVGAFVGWLTTKTGINFGTDFNDGLIALGAFAFTAIGHIWNEKTQANQLVRMAATNQAAPPTTKQGGFTRMAFLSYFALYLLLFAMLVCTMLTSCASVPTPQTFNEKILVGYGADDAIVKSADALVLSGKIAKPVGLNIATQALNLKSALDNARAAYTTSQADGGNQLTMALTALNALTSYLATLQ
jgi:F0F1-type ATP synthase membrane subunit c/vacuolar-type H+-ATPase subunit K